MFFLIILTVPALSLLWWYLADRALREFAPRRRWARVVVAGFMVFNLSFFLFLLGSRSAGWIATPPTVLSVLGYVWYLAVVPLVVTPLVLVFGGARAWAAIRALRQKEPLIAPQDDTGNPDKLALGEGLSRRQFLGLTLVAAPPLLAVAGTGVGLKQIGEFRLRNIDPVLPTLPKEFEGLRILHVTDFHVGRFTKGALLDRIVEETNARKPDLIFITGDVIDYTLRDLPEAVAAINKLRAKHGVFICEGNHDLFESRAGFRYGIRAAGLNLLTNEWTSVAIKGKRLDIGGIAWGGVPGARGSAVRENVAALHAKRTPGADYTVLLAHHPHAFDEAAAADIPLTFAGHTHGGQLMLTKNFGAGSLMFKYWSGLYEKPGSSLIVSNGVGNWMPLRINAPAEIVEVTLRRSPVAHDA